jgi:hypothetical protein
MPQHFAACVARFRNPSGEVCGAGFLIDPRHVMTCAHVINAALVRGSCSQRPDEALCLDLPLAGTNMAEAEIVEWHAPVGYEARNASKPSDLAVLRLKDATSAPVARLAQGRPKWGQKFRTFGFPDEHGQPANGETLEEDAGGWIHFRPIEDYGHLIKPGFSGAPAFATDDDTVLGMIVAIQSGDSSRVAYGEPLRRLQMGWPPMARPYKGLARFDPADADFFFGREDIVRDLLGRLDRDPVTLIVGASGGGKSSLVFGGLLPKLDSGTWQVASFRPGREPVSNLAWVLAKLMVRRADPSKLLDRAEEMQRKLHQSVDTLLGAARALHDTCRTRLLLVVDQFEELFTLCREEDERATFINIITQISRQEAPSLVNLVATLRADFTGDVLRIPALGVLFDGRFLMLRAMNGEEMGRAIKEPARTLGVEFEKGVDDLLLAAVAKDATALPLMEFALERLWAEQQNRRLIRTAYDRMGGLEGALARHADEVVDRMSEAEQVVVRRLLCRLVNIARPGEGEDTKRAQSREELGDELWSVAQRLSGHTGSESFHIPARLVVLYRDERQREVADIIHEALIRHWDRLARWINEARDLGLWRQRVGSRMEDWRKSGRDPSQLLKGPMLTEAVATLESNRGSLTPDEINFVNESREEDTNQRHKQICDGLWDRLELNWTISDTAPRDEIQALNELSFASERIRQNFLRIAVTTETRARRFNRAPAVVLRATLALNAKLAGEFLDWLGETLREDGSIAQERRRAVLEVARLTWPLGHPGLATRVIDLVLKAIAEGKQPDRLQPWGQTIELCEQTIRALAENIDGTAAKATVDGCIATIADTTHWGLLDTCHKIIASVADRVDVAEAQEAAERCVAAMAYTNNLQQLHAYGETILAFADKVDSATVSRAAASMAERLMTSVDDATPAGQLEAFGRTMQRIADKVDCVTGQAAFDRSVAALAGTTNLGLLQMHAEMIQAFAHRVDSAAVVAAATAAVGRSVSVIAGMTVANDRVRAFTKLIQVLAARLDGATAAATVASMNAWLTSPSGLWDVPPFSRDYVGAIRALAKRTDSADAKAIVERSISAIAVATELGPLEAHKETIWAFGSRIDDDAAQAASERCVTAMADTINPGQFRAYLEAIRVFADRLDSEVAHSAIDRLVSDSMKRPGSHPEYRAIIQALARRMNSAFAQAALERSVNAISQGRDPIQLCPNAEAMRAFAGQLDKLTARRVGARTVERLTSAIAETAEPYLLQMYGRTIQVFADELVSSTVDAAATSLIKQLTSAATVDLLAQQHRRAISTVTPNLLREYGDTLRMFAPRIDSAAAQTAVEQSVSAIAETKNRDLIAVHEEILGALSDRVNSAAAQPLAAMIINHLDSPVTIAQMRAFGGALWTLGDKQAATAAATILTGRLLARMSETEDLRLLRDCTDALVWLQPRLPHNAWMFAASEVLKYPALAVIEDRVNSLLTALGNATKPSEDHHRSIWELVKNLEETEPSLQLNRRCQPARIVIGEFHDLMGGGLV